MREDETGEVYRLAKKTTRGIGAEASDASDDAEAKAILKWALESESKKRLDAMTAARGAKVIEVGDDVEATAQRLEQQVRR